MPAAPTGTSRTVTLCPCGSSTALWLGVDLRRGDRAHVGDRQLQRLAEVGVELLERLSGRESGSTRRLPAALLGRVEARGQRQQRGVAAFAHLASRSARRPTAGAVGGAPGANRGRGRRRLPPTRTRRAFIPAVASRSRCGQLVDLGGAQLVGDAVGDEAGGALDDLLAHLEVVLLQRAAGRDQVDDAVGEADQRRQLDRALDLDRLHLASRWTRSSARRCAGTWSRSASSRGVAATRPGSCRPCARRAPCGSARSRGRAARRPCGRTARAARPCR